MNTPVEAAVMAAVGVVGLGLFGRPVMLARRARDWPHTRGTVVSSQVEAVKGSGVKRGMNIAVRVRYRYAVDGGEHESGRVTFFDSVLMRHTFPEIAEAHRRRYREGGKIDVRYDPADPARAVIDPRIPWASYCAVVIAAIFALGGLSLLIRLALRTAR
jgi:uncharacterized protein DUF3592